MNLYLISIGMRIVSYDMYDSAVVVAKDAKQARGMHPSGNQKRWGDDGGSWVNDPDEVSVQLVGTTNYKRARVILASFNAG